MVVITGIPLFFADRLTGGNGRRQGSRLASTAGNAVAVPAIIASENAAYADAAARATILVAASVVGHRHRCAAGHRLDRADASPRVTNDGALAHPWPTI